MKALVLVLSMGLCACTTQQYAQFNQSVNGSISRALGTQTVAPEPHEAVASRPPSPTPEVVMTTQEKADLAYANHVEGVGVKTVTFTPKPAPKQPTAKGISPVDDGAIVCPSLDEVNWLFREIGRARVARGYMPEQARQLTKLSEGYDPWAEPKPSDYQCQFVPTGTPMNVKWEGGMPVVWGKMKDGRPFAGVTTPAMVDY